MKLIALVGTLLLVAIPFTAQELPLGDFGTISYYDHPPDAARTAALIEILFAQFPSVDVPPTSIEIMSFDDFVETMAKTEAGPNWRAWRNSFLHQTDWMYAAFTIRKDARKGELHIVTYQELNDQILVHECLHVIALWLEVDTKNDRPVLNSERQVRDMASSFLTSLRYRKFLADEPWR